MTAWQRVGRYAPGFTALLRYERHNLRPDLLAGLSVAAVALPVGIAYAEIAGVPAVVGIYAAIFPLFAYAIFGSSRQLITGPDAATCIMAATAVAAIAGGDPQRHATLMVGLTLMTGVCYLVAGFLRLGFIANFLSRPILVGYLNGIALIIFVGQVPRLCGFEVAKGGFLAQSIGVVQHLSATHLPTLLVGVGLLLLLILLMRCAPRLPAALVVVLVGIVVVKVGGLTALGVATLGPVPSGLPLLQLPLLARDDLLPLARDAAGIMLISFASGVLTAKSFAERSGDPLDANQELIGFAACNLASGLAQGFPVTGADSRTAVNYATGGRTQFAGIVAGLAMLTFLLFFTAPLSQLPLSGLAAIIIVSAFGLFDRTAVRHLALASRRELLFSLATTAGVLVFGVLPGVICAVLLSVVWLLSVMSRPNDAVLGHVASVAGYHDLKDFPQAETIPGLLIYRFEADLVFFNCDYFRSRLLRHIAAAPTPVEWVLIDASPINVVDYTAVRKIDALRQELAARGISLAYVRAKQSLKRFFNSDWVSERVTADNGLLFPTVTSGVEAFARRADRVTGRGDD